MPIKPITISPNGDSTYTATSAHGNHLLLELEDDNEWIARRIGTENSEYSYGADTFHDLVTIIQKHHEYVINQYIG